MVSKKQWLLLGVMALYGALSAGSTAAGMAGGAVGASVTGLILVAIYNVIAPVTRLRNAASYVTR